MPAPPFATPPFHARSRPPIIAGAGAGHGIFSAAHAGIAVASTTSSWSHSLHASKLSFPARVCFTRNICRSRVRIFARGKLQPAVLHDHLERGDQRSFRDGPFTGPVLWGFVAAADRHANQTDAVCGLALEHVPDHFDDGDSAPGRIHAKDRIHDPAVHGLRIYHAGLRRPRAGGAEAFPGDGQPMNYIVRR